MRSIILTLLVLTAAAPARAQDVIEVQSVLLKLVEKVDVPAEQAGVLREIHVREGDLVHTGDRLAQVDDQAVRMAEQRAAVDVQMADRLARDRIPIEIAHKAAEQARQKLSELKLQEQIAARQAANIFRVEAAEKAQAVAENELTRALKARSRFEDSVSQSEIDGRQLEAEKASLEAQQSRFDHDIDSLKLDVARDALRGQELQVQSADLEVGKAQATHDVAQLQAQLKRHELEMARLDVERRRLLSPLDGVVVEIHKQRGEWVEPGQPVLRILRLNRLWVEGFIRVEHLSRCVEQSPVTVTVPLNADESVDVEGRIVFIGREVDPVNQEVLIRAEIENNDLRLLPGMNGRMSIKITRPLASNPTAGR